MDAGWGNASLTEIVSCLSCCEEEEEEARDIKKMHSSLQRNEGRKSY